MEIPEAQIFKIQYGYGVFYLFVQCPFCNCAHFHKEVLVLNQRYFGVRRSMCEDKTLRSAYRLVRCCAVPDYLEDPTSRPAGCVQTARFFSPDSV